MSASSAATHVAHLLPAFVVGTLAPDERPDVLDHLTGCPACRAELAAWRTIDDALREPVPNQPADDATLREVWRRVDGDPLFTAAVVAVPGHRDRNGHAGSDRQGTALRPDQPLFPPTRAPLTIPTTPPPTPSRWPPGPFLFAAMLMLAIVGVGALVLEPGRALLGQILPGASVLTLEAPGLSGADSEETLVELTVPATLAPPGERLRSYLSHVVIPSHTRSTWDANDAACCPGMRLTYVLKGTYAIIPEGPVQVIRADRTTETAPAGSELLLSGGDAIVLGSDTPFTADNPAASATELLQYFLAYPATFPRGTNMLSGWVEQDYDLQDIRWQGGTAVMRLSRLVLAPDVVLFGEPHTALMQVATSTSHGEDDISPQRMTVSQPNGESTDGLKNLGRETATLYVLSLKQGGATLMP